MPNVLLLGPWTMPQVPVWRRVIAEVAGSCTLATLHPGPSAPEDAAHVVDLRKGRPFAVAFARAVGEIRRLERDRGFDAVLAHYVTSYGTLAALASMKWNQPNDEIGFLEWISGQVPPADSGWQRRCTDLSIRRAAETATAARLHG